MVTQATPNPSDLLPDPSMEVEVADTDSRTQQGGITNQWGQAAHFPNLSENIALFLETFSLCFLFHILFLGKNSSENRLSGFLKELLWGLKQHGGSKDEFVTDGISGA